MDPSGSGLKTFSYRGRRFTHTLHYVPAGLGARRRLGWTRARTVRKSDTPSKRVYGSCSVQRLHGVHVTRTSVECENVGGRRV